VKDGPGTEFTYLFPGWQFAKEIAKPQVSTNSSNSPSDCKKTATKNENLQPKVESNEYSRQL